MSEEKPVCTNELTIRFEQHEGNKVQWIIVPDDTILNTQDLSLIDMAERGAPLSALGIRALWKLCIDGLIFNSLEQANAIEVDVSKRVAAGPVHAELDLVPEGATIN